MFQYVERTQTHKHRKNDRYPGTPQSHQQHSRLLLAFGFKIPQNLQGMNSVDEFIFNLYD